MALAFRVIEVDPQNRRIAAEVEVEGGARTYNDIWGIPGGEVDFEDADSILAYLRAYAQRYYAPQKPLASGVQSLIGKRHNV